MNTNKIIYWAATGILCLVMLFAVFNYFVNYEMVAEMFANLGHPKHVIYPLAVAKLLGVVAILSRKSALLKEWAYAGFFFNTILAVLAHINVHDGQVAIAAVALVAVIVSRIFDDKVFAG